MSYSNNVSNLRIVPFVLICTLLVTNCGTVNNNSVGAIPEPANSTNADVFGGNDKQKISDHKGELDLGVNMRGYYTSMPQSRVAKHPFPNNYYEDSFKILSETKVIDHVRFRFYWESYVKNPVEFIKEIEQVAKTADKYGIKVIYDNHQFHTSSWLNVGRGTGFPTSLFNDPVLYKQNSGGTPKSSAAETWWTNWWNRTIKSVNGTDGWTLQAEFLMKIVSTVDKHPSTLGYEILSEPQVHNKDQWLKIGKYNTFMSDELRKTTNKMIVYSMNIPIDLKSPIQVNSQNLAKMTPKNRQNVVFKFSLYGVPSDGYQGDKLDLFLNASKIAGVPLYVGEWNNVKRIATTNAEGKKIFEISANESDISQTDANMIVQKFNEVGIWGMAYWGWSFVKEKTPNFNLVDIKYDNSTGQGKIQPTKYFEIMKNAYKGTHDQASGLVLPTAPKTMLP